MLLKFLILCHYSLPSTSSLDKIYLQVTSDNKPALDLYKHLGFVEIQRMPLSKQIMHSGTNWLSTSPDTYEEVSRYNITMCLQAQ